MAHTGLISYCSPHWCRPASVAIESIVVLSGAEWQLMTREDDTPSFWGGARIATPMGSCSVAFSAGNIFGKYLLSAGHCFDANGVVVATGLGTITLGPSAHVDSPATATDVSLDIGVVDLSNGDVDGWVWNRGLANAAAAAPLDGSGASFRGMMICTSGAFSGERCDGQVDFVDQLTLSFGSSASGLVDELVVAGRGLMLIRRHDGPHGGVARA